MNGQALVESFLAKAREADQAYPGALSHLYWIYQRVVPHRGRPYYRFVHDSGYLIRSATFTRGQLFPYWTQKFQDLSRFEAQHEPPEGRVAPPVMEQRFTQTWHADRALRAQERADQAREREPDREPDREQQQQQQPDQEPEPEPEPNQNQERAPQPDPRGVRRQRPRVDARDAPRVVIHDSDSDAEAEAEAEPEPPADLPRRRARGEGDNGFRRKVRRLLDEAERLEAEHYEATAELAAKEWQLAALNDELAARNQALTELDQEVATMENELAAKDADNQRLTTQLGELKTCRWYGCDESSVLGLRCDAGHGVCDEHARELCGAIADHLTPVRCVVPGCEARLSETAFLRCGVPHEVALKCTQRLAREVFEAEAFAQRQAEEQRRRDAPGTEITVETLQMEIELKRPCCGNPMTDFTECLAVRCDYPPCQKVFCGICLDASFEESTDCHEHSRKCNKKHFGVENYYLTNIFPGETAAQMQSRLERHYGGIQNARMRAFLGSKDMPMGRLPMNVRHEVV